FCVKIPMKTDARSLNVANSVAVGVYEVIRQADFGGAGVKQKPQAESSGEMQAQCAELEFKTDKTSIV
ncbi:rRNA methylase, putative, group 2, partial [Candidatus Gastranaerophilus sp. (ex Termes propinquus)]